MTPFQTVAIAGAGIAGLVLAGALTSKRAAGLRVVVFAPRVGEVRASGRASAIGSDSVRTLGEMGVWQSIASQAQPIVSMVLTDSRLEDAVRPEYLRLPSPKDGEATAWMIEDDVLREALLAHCHASGVEFETAAIDTAALAQGRMQAGPRGAAPRAVELLVAADGAGSVLRGQMRVPVAGWDYGQGAIVATIAIGRPHEGRADQHFLPEGPFAVLPLVNDRISIVWTQSTEKAAANAGLPADAFLAKVRDVIGDRLGELRLLAGPSVFPLRLRWARRLVGPRFALVGDAAHVIHPLAGQGLNLGLRDALSLAGLVDDSLQLGLDIGAPPLLDAYQRSRRADNLAMIAATDGLNRLFANDSGTLRLLRDVGLGLVDRMPVLKTMFMDMASGGSATARGHSPRER